MRSSSNPSSVSCPIRTFLIQVLCTILMALPSYADDFSVRTIGDYGNVTLMEASGNYDENKPDGTSNVLPRQLIAKEFFKHHKDEYDVLVIFTGFAFKMAAKNELAFYNHVKNDIRGIGQQLYDNSALYGSNGRLQGTIDMGNISVLGVNPLDPRFEDTLDTLSHELLHRWSAYVRFKDKNGAISKVLLGEDESHWSYLLDSKGSLQYGNSWHDNGNGTFSSVTVPKYYSPLDLYLMGMIDKSQVPPMLLIENPAIDPAGLPRPGATVSGTSTYVTIDDIIAAEGERIPNSRDAQKQLKMAFIFLQAPGTVINGELDDLENIRNGFLTRYSILTKGHGLVQVAAAQKEDLPVNPGVRPAATVPRTLPPNIDDGVKWLLASQQADGSWTDFALTTVRDTAEVVTTLQRLSSAQQQYQAGLAWLEVNTYASTDFLARRIEVAVQTGGDTGAFVQELLNRRNPDGGWGSGRSFISSPTDTALALRALSRAGYGDVDVVGKAVAYLQSSQNQDGGWSGDDTVSTIQPTATVVSAFNAYKSHAVEANLTKAIAYLLGKQNPDGGFGNSPSTVYDSAVAVMALQESGADRATIEAGVNYLQGQQTASGSWQESSYQTALAVRAVWQASVNPDLSVKSDDISFIPAKVTALPTTAVVSAVVWNLGRTDVPQAKVAIYDGAVTPEKKVTEQTLAFPGMSPVTVTFPVPINDGNGHYFHLVADPDNLLKESNRNNNTAAKALLPEPTCDFEVLASDITATPNPADFAQEVKMTIRVRNNGTSDAYSVPVRVFIADPAAPYEIASITVDLPAGGTATREVSWRAAKAGVDMSLTVTADATNAFVETYEENNSSIVPLTVHSSTLPNLAISYDDILVTPNPANEGESATVSLLVKNTGFSAVADGRVDLYRGAPDKGGILLGSRAITALNPGESATAAITWADINAVGEQLLYARVVPEGSVQEITKEDNDAFTTLRVRTVADLAVTSSSVVVLPSAPKEGDAVSLVVTVRNTGEQSALGVTVEAREGTEVIGTAVVPLVEGNSQATVSISVATALPSGFHQVRVVVDPESKVVEHHRDNNAAAVAFTVQNSSLWVSEQYISPNGDGIKDGTDFSFRLAAPADVAVVVTNKQGKTVRTFSGGMLEKTAGSVVTWDGRNDAGMVVGDGVYRITAVDVNNASIGSLPVVVDNNRLSLAEAAGTDYVLTQKITGSLPLLRRWEWLPDDSGILLQIDSWGASFDATGLYEPGLYLVSPDGANVTKVVSLEDGEVINYRLSPAGDRVAVLLRKSFRQGTSREWTEQESVAVVDLFSGRRNVESYTLNYRENFYYGVTLHDTYKGVGSSLEWSPDGKKLAYELRNCKCDNFIPLRCNWDTSELWLTTADGLNKTKVDALPFPGAYSTLAWSPDSMRIGYRSSISSVRVSDTAGNKTEAYVSTKEEITELSWFDSTSFFVEEMSAIGYQADFHYWLIDATGRTSPVKLGEHRWGGESSSQISWFKGPFVSPDRRSFVYDTTEGLRYFDADRNISLVYDVNECVERKYPVFDSILWGANSDKLFLYSHCYGNLLKGVKLVEISHSGEKYIWKDYFPASYKLDGSIVHDDSIIIGHGYDNYIGNGVFEIDTSKKTSTRLLTYDWKGFLNEIYRTEKWNDIGISPTQTYITTPAKRVTYEGYHINATSFLHNLTATLSVTKKVSAVVFKGIAQDLNFDSYRLEYSDQKEPGVWNLVAPPSDMPVVNNVFATWIPPHAGTFHVRLTVVDKAGNASTNTRKVSWGMQTAPIANLYKSVDIFSPNGDGVKDTVELKYRVLNPVHLEFTVLDAVGRTVRTFLREHATPGEEQLSWDGRDELGSIASDGTYRIRVLDYEFFVEVDTTPPAAAVQVTPVYLDQQNGIFKVDLTGVAADRNLKSWKIEYGDGENPQVWTEFPREWIVHLKTSAAMQNTLITDFVDDKIGWMGGKTVRITVEDIAGNWKSAVSGRVEERVVLNGWDGFVIRDLAGDPLTAPRIPTDLAKPGIHSITGFETIHLPLAKIILQYQVGRIWFDSITFEGKDDGTMAASWNTAATALPASFAVRVKLLDIYGGEHFSNALYTQDKFEVHAMCNASSEGRSLSGYVSLPENLVSFRLQVKNDSGFGQDPDYMDWTDYDVRQALKGDCMPEGKLSSLSGDCKNLILPPVIKPGYVYKIRMVATGVSGRHYESAEETYPAKCPVKISMAVKYDEAKECGGNAPVLVSLHSAVRESTGRESYKSLSYIIEKPEGAEVLRTVDFAREAWSPVTVSTSTLPAGRYPVKAVLSYLDSTDNRMKEAAAVADLEIDRVFPTAAIHYPAGNSAKLCPAKNPGPKGDWYGIPVEGLVADDNKIKRFELYYGTGQSPLSWSAATAPQLEGPVVVNKQITGKEPVQGRLGVWDVTGLKGTDYSLKLKVLDLVGNQSCSTTRLSLDNAVDVAMTADRSLISAASSENQGEVRATFNIDEYATVDVKVVKLLDTGGLDATPVRTLMSGQQHMPGSGAFTWDGKKEGGVAAPDGRYAMVISAADACGNSSLRWTPAEVDSTAPTIAIDYPQAGSTLSSGNVIEVKGTAVDSNFQQFTLEIGEGDNPVAWSGIAKGGWQASGNVIGMWNSFGHEGKWTLRLSATDRAGNRSATTSTIDLGVRSDPDAIRTIIRSVDVSPKVFSPNNDGKVDTGVVTYELTEASQVMIDVVTKADGAVTTSMLDVVAPGAYSFVWDGKNGAGAIVNDGLYQVKLTVRPAANPDVHQTEVISVTVDNTKPTIELKAPDDKAFVNKAAVEIIGTVWDPNVASYGVKVTGPAGTLFEERGTQTRTEYSFGTITDPAEGSYSVSAEATDQAGNVARSSRTFMVDRTAPKVVLDAPADGESFGSTKGIINIAGSIAETNLDRYSLRYGAGGMPTEWKEIVTGTAIPASILYMWKVGKDDGISDGSYVISLHARDKAGLETDSRRRITVDNALPEVVVSSPAEGSFVKGPSEIRGTAYDSNLETTVIDLSEGTCSTASKWTPLKTLYLAVRDQVLDSWRTLPNDGDYCLRVTTWDKVGNKADSKINIVVNAKPPSAPTVTGKSYRTTANLEWSKNTESDLAGYYLYRDGRRINNSPVSETSYQDLDLQDGTYSYTVTAVDMAGNESLPSSSLKLEIDLTGPAARITSPQNNAEVQGLVEIRGTAFSSDDFKEYRVSVGEGANPSAWNVIRTSPLSVSAGVLALLDIQGVGERLYSVKVDAEDLSGNITSEVVSVAVDNVPPVPPALLTATANAVDVTVTWSANAEADLAGYLLYRNDQIVNGGFFLSDNLGRYVLSGTAYIDKSLRDGTYTYYLAAMDQAGNISGASSSLMVDIDVRPPAATVIEPANGSRLELRTRVQAKSSDNDISHVRFQYKKADDADWTDMGTPVTAAPFITFFDPKQLGQGLPFGEYQLRAVAIDRGGKSDAMPASITVIYTDLTPPAVPSGVHATTIGDRVTLSWDSNTDIDLEGYLIYRTRGTWRSRVDTAPIKALEFQDSAIEDGTYIYEVTAVDTHGNESSPSAGVISNIYSPILLQPYTPTGLMTGKIAGANVPSGVSIEVLKETSTGSNSVGKVTADQEGAFSLEDVPLSAGGNIFTAKATDSAGNTSKLSKKIFLTAALPPSPPVGTVAAVEGHSVSVSWQPNVEPDVVGYNVYRDGTKLNPPQSIATGQATASSSASPLSEPQKGFDTDPTTAWVTADDYWVEKWWQLELDSQELLSHMEIDWLPDYSGKDFEVQAWSGDVWVTVAKVTGNVSNTNKIRFVQPYRTNRVRISITAADYPSSRLQVGIAEVRVLKEGLVAQPFYYDANLPARRYGYSVTAVCYVGFESGLSEGVRADVGDLIPPEPPRGLTATASGASIILTWLRNGEDDLAGYNVYRYAAGAWVKLSSVTAIDSALTETGLLNGPYSYRITAVDTTGNESMPSDIAVGTVAVAASPTPINLQVVAAPEGRILRVTWDYPGESGIASFNIFRASVSGGPYAGVGSVPSSVRAFSESGLANGTPYYYVVTAVDSTGRESAYSSEGLGIPADVVPPAQPSFLSPTVAGIPAVAQSTQINVAVRADASSTVELFKDGLSIGRTASLQSEQLESVPVDFVSNPVLSPEGNLLVYTDYTGALVLKDLASDSVQKISDSGSAPVWSPRSDRIAFQRTNGAGNTLVYIYDLSTRTISPLTDGTQTTCGSLPPSPPPQPPPPLPPPRYSVGDAMYGAVTPEPVYAETTVPDASSGFTCPLYEGSPSWSSDGTRMAYLSNRGNIYSIWVKDFTTGSSTSLMRNGTNPKISPDGQKIGYFIGTNTLSVFDLVGSSIVMTEYTTDGSSLEWFPDSSRVMFQSTASRGSDLFVKDIRTFEKLQVTVDGMQKFSPSISKDGLKVMYARNDGNGIYTIWSTDTNGQRVLVRTGNSIPSIRWGSWGNVIFFYPFEKKIFSLYPKGVHFFPNIRLDFGDNVFSAVAIDDSGNNSPASEEMSVSLGMQLAPDVTVGADDIYTYPQFPKPGETVTVNVAIRNQRDVQTGQFSVDIYVWDERSGLQLIKSSSISSLLRNGEAEIEATYQAGSTGFQSIIIVADPADSVLELEEGNNVATKELHVADTEEPVMNVSVDSSVYYSNSTSSIDLHVMNPGDERKGELTVRIEDKAGNPVASIASVGTVVGYGQTHLAYTWNTGITMAGAYRVHAVFVWSDGISTESIAELSILPDARIDIRTSTDRQRYRPYEEAVLTAEISTSGSNSLFYDAAAKVRIADSADNVVFTHQKLLGTLIPSTSATVVSRWNTGCKPGGSYRAVTEIYLDGKVISTSSVEFVIEEALEVKGTVTPEYTTALAGTDVRFLFTVANTGNVTASGNFEASIIVPEGGTLVKTQMLPIVIGVGDSSSGEFVLSTVGLGLGPYVIQLKYEAGAAKNTIATSGFTLKDGTAPVVTVISPAVGAIFNTEVLLAVSVTDDVSGVGTVQYQIDGGEWNALPLADPGGARYSVVLNPTLSENGTRIVSLRATDRANNVSIPVSLPVTFDMQPPVLNISSLSDGAFTNNEVFNLAGTVTDNSGIQGVTVNGMAVPVGIDGSFSHALLLQNGVNSVTTLAIDVVGNQTTESRSITFDQSVPVLTVTHPADNSTTGTSLLAVTGNAEKAPIVEIKTDSFVQMAEMNGSSYMAMVNLARGTNTIEVTATDLEGKRAGLKRTVVYDEQKPSVAITSPNQDIKTNKGSLIIKGTASDPMAAVSVSLIMDDQVYTPPVVGGAFEQAVTFSQEKTYAIVATATNEGGTPTTVQRNVIYDTTPPALTVNPVASPTDQQDQLLSGTREAGLAVAVTCPTASVGTVSYPSDTTWEVGLSAVQPGDNLITVTSEDSAGNANVVTTTIRFEGDQLRVIFSAAVFGDNGVTISGDATVDSYIGNPAFYIEGQHGNGDVGTNSLQSCAIQLDGSANIFGKAWVGPGGDSGTGICAKGGASIFNNSRGSLAKSKDMRPMTDPGGGTPIGALTMRAATSTLSAGDYRVTSIDLSGGSTLYLSGKVTLHVDGDIKVSGGAKIVASSGPVNIYVNGENMSISGGSILNDSKDPRNVTIYGTAGLQAVDFSGGADLYGLIFAPNAAITFSGGGDVFGSVIGKRVSLAGGSSVHYYEDLIKW